MVAIFSILFLVVILLLIYGLSKNNRPERLLTEAEKQRENDRKRDLENPNDWVAGRGPNPMPKTLLDQIVDWPELLEEKFPAISFFVGFLWSFVVYFATFAFFLFIIFLALKFLNIIF